MPSRQAQQRRSPLHQLGRRDGPGQRGQPIVDPAERPGLRIHHRVMQLALPCGRGAHDVSGLRRAHQPVRRRLGHRKRSSPSSPDSVRGYQPPIELTAKCLRAMR